MLKFSPALQSQIDEMLLKPWTTVGMRWGLPSSRTAATMEVTAPWPFGTCAILVKSEVSTLLLTMTRLFLTPSCSPTALFPRWRNDHLLKYSHPLPFHCPSAMMHIPVLPAYTTVFQNCEMFIHPSQLSQQSSIPHSTSCPKKQHPSRLPSTQRCLQYPPALQSSRTFVSTTYLPLHNWFIFLWKQKAKLKFAIWLHNPSLVFCFFPF